MIRRLLVPVAAAALLAATLPLAASTASTATSAPGAAVQAPITYTVCYRKRTGEMRLLLATKCPRGWKRIRLAAPREVIDANGTVLGSFQGAMHMGFYPMYAVETADGGVWTYEASGVVSADNYAIYHLDAACSSPAFTLIPGTYVSMYATPDPSVRAAVVVNNVAVAAYALSSPPTAHGAAPIWYRDEVGACVAGAFGAPNPYRIPLTAVPLPIQGVGPLRVV